MNLIGRSMEKKNHESTGRDCWPQEQQQQQPPPPVVGGSPRSAFSPPKRRSTYAHLMTHHVKQRLVFPPTTTLAKTTPASNYTTSRATTNDHRRRLQTKPHTHYGSMLDTTLAPTKTHTTATASTTTNASSQRQQQQRPPRAADHPKEGKDDIRIRLTNRQQDHETTQQTPPPRGAAGRRRRRRIRTHNTHNSEATDQQVAAATTTSNKLKGQSPPPLHLPPSTTASAVPAWITSLNWWWPWKTKNVQQPDTSSSQHQPRAAAHGTSKHNEPFDLTEISRAVSVGCINAVVAAPVMISFAQIIFRDAFFHPYMPALVKLVLFSSLVHQLCFSLKSSLPFAIGQVQDAGLIFLCAMATNVVHAMRDERSGELHLDPSAVLCTVLFTLAVGTASLGLALIITGQLKLAQLVQYLPMPVVGGYLAYIGFFCLESGIRIMAGVPVAGISGVFQVLLLPSPGASLDFVDPRLLAAPGVIAGCLLLYITTHFQHRLVLPACMVSIPLLFFLVLGLAGCSLEEARSLGWVAPIQDEPRFYHTWSGFENIASVQWSQIPKQLGTWLAMYFVVSFSSCLDVAAIEMDMGKPLNFNHELKTVGVSNLVSGITGGFTGSYIFSLTIFSHRGASHSRIPGFVVFFAELLLFLAPISVIAYVPRLFFGAVLTFIAGDLMIEWLISTRRRVPLVEYIVIWLTFAAINMVGLEAGMLAGVVMAGFTFIYRYSHVPGIQRVSMRSNVQRSFDERMLLGTALDHEAIVVLRPHGYLFFGSIIRLVSDVRKCVILSPVIGSSGDEGDAGSGTFQAGTESSSVSVSKKPPAKEDTQFRRHTNHTQFLVLDWSRVTGLDTTATRQIRVLITQLRQGGVTTVFCALAPEVHYLLGADGVLPSQGLVKSKPNGGTDLVEQPRLYRPGLGEESPLLSGIVEFEGKSEDMGADGVFRARPWTPQRFGSFHRTTSALQGPPVLPQIAMVLPCAVDVECEGDMSGACDMGGMEPMVFDNLDVALEWCEEQILCRVFTSKRQEALVNSARARAKRLIRANRSSNALNSLPFQHSVADILMHIIARERHDGDSEQGGSHLSLPQRTGMGQSALNNIDSYFNVRAVAKGVSICARGDPAHHIYFVEKGEVTCFLPSDGESGGVQVKRLQKVLPGGVFGELDFFLRQPRSFSARVSSAPSGGAVLHCISASRYSDLVREAPQQALALQTALLKGLCLSLTDHISLFAT